MWVSVREHTCHRRVHIDYELKSLFLLACKHRHILHALVLPVSKQLIVPRYTLLHDTLAFYLCTLTYERTVLLKESLVVEKPPIELPYPVLSNRAKSSFEK